MKTASVLVEHSRTLLLAEHASGLAPSRLQQRLEASTVVVSVDAAMPQSVLTTRVLLTTLRRGLGHLVLIPDGLAPATVEALEVAVAAIDPDRPLRVGRQSTDEKAVRLHVGADATGQIIRIAPEGYGAHIASGNRAVIRPRRAGNSLGAAYTAALGAAEVFKHAASVVSARRVLHRHLRFCPVSLSTDFNTVPDLGEVELDLTLVGVGAIGTGIVLVLSELPIGGRLLAVDCQHFAPENKGTYSLGGVAEVAAAPWKVDLARRTLPRFDTRIFTDPVEQLPTAIDAGNEPWYPTVLSALDSPEARRETQRMWPNQLIDAATGDTMLGISDYRHAADPCMNCVFPPALDQPSGAERIASKLGLPAELLAHGETVLSEEHLTGLALEHRKVLEPHLGKPVCGLAAAVGLTGHNDETYMPSVPFVSLQAACLSVGRLIAHSVGMNSSSNFVQYDGLIGPQRATMERMRIKPGCQCVMRSAVIEQVRTIRNRDKVVPSQDAYNDHMGGSATRSAKIMDSDQQALR